MLVLASLSRNSNCKNGTQYGRYSVDFGTLPMVKCDRTKTVAGNYAVLFVVTEVISDECKCAELRLCLGYLHAFTK